MRSVLEHVLQGNGPMYLASLRTRSANYVQTGNLVINWESRLRTNVSDHAQPEGLAVRLGSHLLHSVLEHVLQGNGPM